MAEAALVVAQQRRVIEPDFVGAQQQLGEIYDALLLADFLIAAVYPQHGGDKQVVAEVFNVPRAFAFVFLAIDKPLRLARWPAAFVQLQLPVDTF